MASNAAPSKAHGKLQLKNHHGATERTPSYLKKQLEDSVAKAHAVILQGAINFRHRTGLPPTTPTKEAFYESVKDSLPIPLSRDQVYRRLRHIHRNLKYSTTGDSDDIVMNLAAQLWLFKDVKEGTSIIKDPKKKIKFDTEKVPYFRKRQSDNSVSETYVAILRGAIAFQNRTGLPPTRPNMEALYESVADSLPVMLSKEQVYRRLRHIRSKLEHSTAVDGDDLVMKLASQLWPFEDVKEKMKKKRQKLRKEVVGTSENEMKDKRQKLRKEVVGTSENERVKKKGKMLKPKQEFVVCEQVEEEDKKMQGMNEGEWGNQLELFPYVTHNIEEYWKANSLSKESLEMTMKHIDPAKANILEKKWKRHFEDEMRLQMEMAKVHKELFAMILATHKVRDN